MSSGAYVDTYLGGTYFYGKLTLWGGTCLDVKLICKCFLTLNLVKSDNSSMKIIMCFPFGAENKFIYKQTKIISISQNFNDRKLICN